MTRRERYEEKISKMIKIIELKEQGNSFRDIENKLNIPVSSVQRLSETSEKPECRDFIIEIRTKGLYEQGYDVNEISNILNIDEKETKWILFKEDIITPIVVKTAERILEKNMSFFPPSFYMVTNALYEEHKEYEWCFVEHDMIIKILKQNGFFVDTIFGMLCYGKE